MKHPSEAQIALFAGGDLDGYWNRWRVRRHIAQCRDCQAEVGALRDTSELVREVAAESPKDLNWSRLAAEMTGNIRVGLAAGEAIARFDRPAARRPFRLGWNAAFVLGCATVVFLIAFWISLPRPQADHLISVLHRIRPERTGSVVKSPIIAPDEVVLEATAAGIEVKENGRAMSLTHPHSDGVTVSVSLQGSAGIRYVDADTGQVTTNKVYYAEP
ncbi:MAG TPA: hypothetical protein VKX49_23740 [Bryobacteraceae bacterium]|nr:hypothetical protein [Bryobacteraceae bacterium]